MANKDDRLGSLFGKAKKWLKDELATDGGDANEGVEEDMRLEATRARDAALADALMPEGWKQAAADRERREADEARTREADARRDRAATAGGSHLTLRGTVDGSIDTGLAVQTERGTGTLVVSVTPVDPVPLRGGSFAGLSFTVTGYSGPGTYDLAAASEPDDPYAFELLLHGVESEGFFWSPSYGPGVVTVPADEATAGIHFVYQDPGSNRVEVQGVITLT